MATFDAKDLFAQSIRFHRSAGILAAYTYQWAKAKQTHQSGPGFGGTSTDFPPTMIVGFVCEAFAAELMLKAIWMIEGMPPPKKHELDFLYNQIPQAWKDRISKAYADELAKPVFSTFHSASGTPNDIEENLGMAAKGFVGWRYLFEAKPPSQFLAPASNAIGRSILEVKPDWTAIWLDFDIPTQLLPLSAQALDDERLLTQAAGSPAQDLRPKPD